MKNKKYIFKGTKGNWYVTENFDEGIGVHAVEDGWPKGNHLYVRRRHRQ